MGRLWVDFRLQIGGEGVTKDTESTKGEECSTAVPAVAGKEMKKEKVGMNHRGAEARRERNIRRKRTQGTQKGRSGAGF